MLLELLKILFPAVDCALCRSVFFRNRNFLNLREEHIQLHHLARQFRARLQESALKLCSFLRFCELRLKVFSKIGLIVPFMIAKWAFRPINEIEALLNQSPAVEGVEQDGTIAPRMADDGALPRLARPSTASEMAL